MQPSSSVSSAAAAVRSSFTHDAQLGRNAISDSTDAHVQNLYLQLTIVEEKRAKLVDEMRTNGYSVLDVPIFDGAIDYKNVRIVVKHMSDKSNRGVQKVFKDMSADDVSGGAQLRQVVVPVPIVKNVQHASLRLDGNAVDDFYLLPARVQDACSALTRKALSRLPLFILGSNSVAGCAFLGNFAPAGDAKLVDQDNHVDQVLLAFREPPPVFIFALLEPFNLIVYNKSHIVVQRLVDAAALVNDSIRASNKSSIDYADDLIGQASPIPASVVRVDVGQGVMLCGNTVHASHMAEVVNGMVVTALRLHIFFQLIGEPYPQEDNVTHTMDNLAPGLKSTRVAQMFPPLPRRCSD